MHFSTMGFKLVCLKSVNKVRFPHLWGNFKKKKNLLRLYIKGTDSGICPNVRNFG